MPLPTIRIIHVVLVFSILLLSAAQYYYYVNDPPRRAGLGRGDVVLPVSKRFQWQDAYGYCGETSLQITLLYYGTWASTWTIRDMSIQLKNKYYTKNLSQKDKESQWFISVNGADPILDAFHLTYSSFDSANTPEPQYKPFMLWVKHNIQELKVPVIIGMYVKGSTDPDFDHVAVAHGILSYSPDPKSYSDHDIILFTPLQETTGNYAAEAGYYFHAIGRTRQATEVGDDTFTIPSYTSYGVAIHGFRNMHLTFNTRIELVDSYLYEQPSLAGCDKNRGCFSPRQVSAAIIIEGLTVGQKYSILRFDSPTLVPDHEATWCTSTASVARLDFQATKTSFRAITSFFQTSIVTFRTVAACPDWSNTQFKSLQVVTPTQANNRAFRAPVYNDLAYYFGANFDVTAYPPPEMPAAATYYPNTVTGRRQARRERRSRYSY